MPRSNRVVSKAKNQSYALSKLLQYIKRYLPAIIAALILGMIGAILSVIGPNILSDITDTINRGLASSIDLETITNLAITLVCLYLCGWLFNYIQSFILATVTQRMSKSLREAISIKINKLPLSYFDKTSYGDILSRITNDVDTMSSMMTNSLATLISSLTLLLGSLFMMYVTNALLATTAIIASIFGFVFIVIIMSKSQIYFSMQQKTLGKINGYIEEMYSGHNVVKAYNGQTKAKEEFQAINEDLYNSAYKSQFFSGLMMPLMNLVGNLGYVAVCVLGAILTANGTITFGVIISFIIYIRLFTQPLSNIAQVFTSMQSALAASERVFEFLDEKEVEDESHKDKVLENVKGDVTFDHVRFGYDEDRVIIHDFSASIKAGQTVAIVGPTGAGKTTIVNLLMRFYETDSGDILIDGIPIKELKRENVRDLFCMVLQDTWLFEGTLRENIVYSKEGITDAHLDEVCKAVGLSHFVKTLPNGYDTVLSETTTLSQGQKQLVTIARAMIENAPLLILDEATSSVDTKTEVIVQKAMDELTKGRTSFIIAHRLSTIRNADVILVMKDGDIVESGNHNELLQRNGFYAKLYNSQFED